MNKLRDTDWRIEGEIEPWMVEMVRRNKWHTCWYLTREIVQRDSIGRKNAGGEDWFVFRINSFAGDERARKTTLLIRVGALFGLLPDWANGRERKAVRK